VEHERLDLLTLDELAQKLKIRKSWLYVRTREKGKGTIPKIKVGKYIRFDEAKVIEWLKRKQDAE
jgi:excisionase family DNA binding protein